MTDRCPTCGQTLPPCAESGEQLVARMRSDGFHGCYQGQDGGYHLEHGKGKVSRASIDDALAKGLIVPRWEDAPHLQYWKFA